MQALLGGIIIGIAVSLMLLYNGRVTGISGIVGGLLKKETLDKNWRFLFLAGLLTGGFIIRISFPELLQITTELKVVDLLIAGFLVGYGTSLGNGCTSGHGVCGISRFSLRSIWATVVFIVFGILSVLIFKFLRGHL